MSEGTPSATSSSPASAAPSSRWAAAHQGTSPSPLEGAFKPAGGGTLDSLRAAGAGTPAAPAAPASDPNAGGGGGIEGTPPAQPSGGAAPASGAPPAPTGTPPTGAPPVFQLDQATLQQLVSQVGQAPAGQQQQQPQPTEEELNQLLNIFKVDAAALQAMGIENPTEQQVAFYNNVVQGTAKQAVTLASYGFAHELNQLKAQYAPIVDFFRQQQMEAMKDRFFQKFPGLTGMEPLLIKIRDHIIASGRKFKDETEAFQAVHDEAIATAKQLGLDVSKFTAQPAAGAAPAGGAQTSAQPTPSTMPTLSRGGQGGAGEAGAGGGNMPRWRKAHS